MINIRVEAHAQPRNVNGVDYNYYQTVSLNLMSHVLTLIAKNSNVTVTLSNSK